MTTATHSAHLDNETFADVLDATRLYVTDYCDEYAFVESWRADHGVARQFGHDGFYHPGRKFAGQVKRALDRLVEDGTLIKVARGERHPGGGTASVHPGYYTPESWARSEARAATEAEADRVEALHWSEVREALRRAEITGYDGIDLGSGEPRLTLEAWQGLVARLP